VRLVVVGGGVIGLAVAWRATQRGAEVTVVDPRPGRGASWVAGGMLAPAAEAHRGERAVLALGLASAARWAGFAAELETASGIDAGYSRHGTLVVARDADEATELTHRLRLHHDWGLPAERLTSRQARRLEPALAPTVRGALWLADDHQVDNRLLVEALLAAVIGAGVAVVDEPASLVEARRVHLASGPALDADDVVVATGAGAPPIRLGDGTEVALPVRPVKGQILRVQATPAAVFPRHTVRGPGIYVIPRPHGEIAIGATTEERGDDTAVTAGAVLELLRDSWELVPGLAEATFVEAIAGLRPGTPDNAPIIGRLGTDAGTDTGVDVDGPLVATGHHRNGVLLAPITADLVVSLALDGRPATEADTALIEPVSPDRFAPTTVAP
jgi:glycine oxidase